MALDKSALLELTEALSSADDGQLMRRLLHAILQALIDAEAAAHIGADPHERTETRITRRNGTRDKTISTAAGDLSVKIAKTRNGSFFPSLLTPRRRIDVALHAVVMEAYVHGVSTRKVDDLVIALGAESGISKSEVSRICAELDTEVAAFNGRDLGEQAFPYVFLDATYCKARVGGDKHGKGARVTSQAVVIATGVSADGRREVLGCAVGDSETEDFWTEFLRTLRDRGLSGTQLVISDHHRGLMNAIDTTMTGVAWQRMLGALHEKRPRQGPQGSVRDGRSRDPDHLCPARRPTGSGSGRDHRAHARTPPTRSSNDAARREGADHRLGGLPRSALAQDLVDQPVGAAEQGGQTPNRRRGHLPQPRRAAAPSDLRADRVTRRMAGHRPPLPLRGIHGPAHPALLRLPARWNRALLRRP